MFTVRADLFLLGYCKLEVDQTNIGKVSDLFLKKGISARFSSDGKFLIPYFTSKKIISLLDGKVEYKISEPKGVLGFILKNKKKAGAFVGIFFVAILLIFSSDVVWDVRVFGDGEVNEADVVRELEECGLAPGKRWSDIDTSKIEIALLQKSETVSWLNINRRGGVAYVKFSIKNVHKPEEKPSGYANIVASRDCVIEEIVVKRGYAMVQKGESVRQGQILISGVIPTELGGGICYAEGEVKGRYSETVGVSLAREIEEVVYGDDELVFLDINFFGLKLNIYKKYRQSQDSCDIIEKKEAVTVVKRLPVVLISGYSRAYSISKRQLSDKEIVELASERMREELLLFLSDKEALRLSVKGDFCENGYQMICDTVVTSDIAEIREIYANLE